MFNRCVLLLLIALLIATAVAQTAPATAPATAPQAAPAAFNGVDQWRGALQTSDATSFRAMYSSDPPARYVGDDGKPGDLEKETGFWQDLMKSGVSDLSAEVAETQEQRGLKIVDLLLTLKVKTPDGMRTRYVREQQAWQPQEGGWRIVVVRHTGLLKMKQPTKPNPNLYEKNADARADIKAAVDRAAKAHKRVILVFGGNWCYDCHVLDFAFHQPDAAPIVEKSFEVVHVDIGDDSKKNADLVEQYKIPLERGVPALAILDDTGKLLYSQQNGEFEAARSLDPDDIIAFLNKWKP